MIAEALDIGKETYFAILLDRSFGGPVMIGCPEGGMDIESLAQQHPSKMLKEHVNISRGVTAEQALRMAHHLGFADDLVEQAADQIKKLYNLFAECNCLQLEVNPFGSTPDGRIVCFDAKIIFDDNAKHRYESKLKLEEAESEEVDWRERDASKYGLNYVGMQGDIGCLVNGAGLAMATMDIIDLHGGKPANFLDVGGGATESQIYEAMRLISSDPQVKSIFVNIFGGIMKCDVIARGLIAATERIAGWKWPLVVRLSGTNVEEGMAILRQSKVYIK